MGPAVGFWKLVPGQAPGPVSPCSPRARASELLPPWCPGAGRRPEPRPSALSPPNPGWLDIFKEEWRVRNTGVYREPDLCTEPCGGQVDTRLSQDCIFPQATARLVGRCVFGVCREHCSFTWIFTWKGWKWSSNTLATWCEAPTHWKRPWCWERLKAGGEGDDRGWDGWMASPTQWTWVWANSERW